MKGPRYETSQSGGRSAAEGGGSAGLRTWTTGTGLFCMVVSELRLRWNGDATFGWT